jgi:hypothetical protein
MGKKRKTAPKPAYSMNLYDPTVNPTGVAIDMDQVNKQLTPEEQAAWEKQKVIQDKINAEAVMPTPGQLQIDPKIAGWEVWKSPEEINKTFDEEFQRLGGNYQAAKIGYDPYGTERGGTLQGQNLDPYGIALRNKADQAEEQAASAYAQLATQGRMSASDRMSLANRFNQAKIAGKLGAGQKLGQSQGEQAAMVGQFNMGRGDAMDRLNVKGATEASMQNAAANEARMNSLAKAQFDKQTKDRELLSAGKIADIQKSKNKASNPWNPMEWFS